MPAKRPQIRDGKLHFPKPRCYAEDAEARALISWAELFPETRGRLVHVPNEGQRTPAQAERMKLAGMRPGYPDYLLDVAVGEYHGLRIELKAPAVSRVEPEQVAWLDLLAAEGYACMVARGWVEASRGVRMYLDGRFPPWLG